MTELAPLVYTDEDAPDLGAPAFHIQFSSNLDRGREVVQAAMDVLKEFGRVRDERTSYHAWLCLEETVTNAIRHGNEFDESKSGRLFLWLLEDRWIARVEDQGKGFDPRNVADPLDELDRDHGRGIFLLRSVMENVAYYSGGRVVQFECLDSGASSAPRTAS